MQGFRLREPFNFQAAEQAEGFVGRSGYPGDVTPECWGGQVFPRFIVGSGFDTAPSSLSVWDDLETLMAFTYSGVHADALKHARNWNVERLWPALVLWWADKRPDWTEAVARFERLHDHGAGPEFFHFKEPYGHDGEKITVDRARVRQIAAVNATRQQDMLAAVHGMRA